MNGNARLGAAIVTGASRGLGHGIARRLADAGHPVVLVARGADELERAAASIRAAGAAALAVRADVASEEDVASLVALAHERFGPPAALVNNAGAAPVLGTLDDLTWAQFAHHVDVDVRGTFNLTRALAPAMRAQGHGTIVNVAAAAAGTVYSPLHTALSPAQASLLALTRCTATWLAPAGVRVHCLCPRLTLAGGVGQAAATRFGATAGLSPQEWVQQRLGGETLTSDQVGDAVVALLDESDGATWHVTPAGLQEWDPFAAAVAS